ncbi:MAG: hypothetical protein AAFN77_24005 [Planctomycetota bacterium]
MFKKVVGYSIVVLCVSPLLPIVVSMWIIALINRRNTSAGESVRSESVGEVTVKADSVFSFS